MQNLYHGDTREEFDKSVDLGRAGAPRETPHKEDLKCTGCGGIYSVTLLRNSIDVEPIEDVYDVSFRADRGLGDYINAWSSVFHALDENPQDEAAVRVRITNAGVRTFTEYHFHADATQLDGAMLKHVQMHHPAKLRRLDRLALMAGNFRDLTQLRQLYNEVERLLRGKDDRRSQYPEAAFRPDLLEGV